MWTVGNLDSLGSIFPHLPLSGLGGSQIVLVMSCGAGTHEPVSEPFPNYTVPPASPVT